MTLQEAQTLVLRVLKQVMEEKLDHHNVQLAQVGTLRDDAHSVWPVVLTAYTLQVLPASGFEILDEVRLKEIIDGM